MLIAIPRETDAGETRAAATPDCVARLVKLGAGVTVESGLGRHSGFVDEAYEQAGAAVTGDRRALLQEADLVLRVRTPPAGEIDWLKPGSIHVSFLDPFRQTGLLPLLAQRSISAVSMEMIPRTTRAQKMDALTSQANLAGYAAVVQGAAQLPRIFPMMSTAAGTILPARVFIIGAGVAGLQAIATARRMGAKVEAFDTRPVVAEQVASLGARFVKIDLGGEQGQTEQGYARELTPEQIERQREGMKKCCADADLVVTTAQVFGRRAPLIVMKEMVSAMRPGSVIVDMAVDSGGNVEGSVPGEVAIVAGVRIIGDTNLAGRLPQNASQVYGMNLVGLIDEFWDKESVSMKILPEDDLMRECLITHAGAICHPRFANGGTAKS